jgi:hypothetical protein
MFFIYFYLVVIIVGRTQDAHREHAKFAAARNITFLMR